MTVAAGSGKEVASREVRLRFLDGLREVAALVVVLCHVVVGFHGLSSTRRAG